MKSCVKCLRGQMILERYDEACKECAKNGATVCLNCKVNFEWACLQCGKRIYLKPVTRRKLYDA